MRALQCCVLLILIALTGCFSTSKTMRYSVLPPVKMGTPLSTFFSTPYSGITVRVAKDLRAYDTPLRFKANGAVEPYRALSYYAPLEIALDRALSDLTICEGRIPKRLTVVVKDYCIQEDDQGNAKVQISLVTRLEKKDTVSIRIAEDLPKDYTPQQVRDAFARLLPDAWEDFLEMCEQK